MNNVMQSATSEMNDSPSSPAEKGDPVSETKSDSIPETNDAKSSIDEVKSDTIIKADDAQSSNDEVLINSITETNDSQSSNSEIDDFVAEKQKYLEMPLEEKRELYRTKKFVELEDIPTWQTYYSSEKSYFESTYDKYLAKTADQFPAQNDELNEKISLWQGDITTLEIGAIVNAANNALLGGGGVDGAIHRAAGPFLKKECRTLNGCETGDAKITGGYKLPAKFVIHTVGPRGEKPDLLKSCYTRCLELMLENNIRTIAFPCISTGIYGYSQKGAANLALGTIRTFLEENAKKVDRIIFTLFLDEDVQIYETLTQVYFPVK